MRKFKHAFCYTIKANNEYNYVLTSEGNQFMKAVIYTITYDASKIKINSICNEGKEKESFGIIVDKDINIISNSNGVLKFKVNKSDKNWSGILANLNFTALTDGETTIKFNAE